VIVLPATTLGVADWAETGGGGGGGSEVDPPLVEPEPLWLLVGGAGGKTCTPNCVAAAVDTWLVEPVDDVPVGAVTTDAGGVLVETRAAVTCLAMPAVGAVPRLALNSARCSRGSMPVGRPTRFRRFLAAGARFLFFIFRSFPSNNHSNEIMSFSLSEQFRRAPPMRSLLNRKV
jgi:hypothetical protein